jgi:hypothetical protein
MLTLATLAVVVSTLAAGAYLASGPSGTPRPVRLQALCACWPLLAGLMVWQLARFASNTNDEGGDITAQLLMYALAFLQLPLLGVGVLGGLLYRASTEPARPPAAATSVASVASPLPAAEPAGWPAREPPILDAPASIAARSGKIVALGLAVLAGACIMLGAVKGVQRMDANSGYPHALDGEGGSLPGTDYGPDIRAASTEAPFPILWLGPEAFGQKLDDVVLTTRARQYPTFEPSAIVDYDAHGTIQISEGLAPSNGANDAFMTGPSITVHGATFFFYQGFAGSPALGRIRGRDIRIDAPASTRAQWAKTLGSLRWACPPTRPHCSGW